MRAAILIKKKEYKGVLCCKKKQNCKCWPLEPAICVEGSGHYWTYNVITFALVNAPCLTYFQIYAPTTLYSVICQATQYSNGTQSV